jgi:hypothetical protein
VPQNAATQTRAVGPEASRKGNAEDEFCCMSNVLVWWDLSCKPLRRLRAVQRASASFVGLMDRGCYLRKNGIHAVPDPINSPIGLLGCIFSEGLMFCVVVCECMVLWNDLFTG